MADEEENRERSVITTLPDELFSEIISLATQAHDKDRQRHDYPSVLCKVARYWRTATLSSPRVWAFIFITGRPNLQHIQTRLARAGRVPLDIKILDTNKTIQPSNVMDLLLPSSSRWSTLHLAVPTISDYTNNFPDILPLLRRIIFDDDGARFSLKISLPLLKHMRLKTTCMFWESSSKFLNLTEFCTSSIGGGDHLQVGELLAQLGCMPNLEVLELSYLEEFEDLDLPGFERLRSRPLILFQLRELRLDPLYSWEAVVLLSLLRAPILGTLMLGVSGNHPTAPGWFPIDQLHLNLPYLETVVLKDTRVPAKDIHHLLLQTPSIRRLSVINHYTQCMGPILESIFTNHKLAAVTSHLSVLVSKGIHLATLRDIFSLPLSAEVSQTVSNQLTLRVCSEDLHIDSDGGNGPQVHDGVLVELDELRGLVSHVECIDGKLCWE